MNWNQPKVFAVQHKDERIRARSRSGGIFTALSHYVLENNGIGYGWVLAYDFSAVHVRAESKNDRNQMRGSKYIQSCMSDTFRLVKDDLESGRAVLFSGTSCQVAGLRGYLGIDYNNLFWCGYRLSWSSEPEGMGRYGKNTLHGKKKEFAPK